MKVVSKQTKALLYSVDKGYKVIDNVVFRPDGKVVKCCIGNRGYTKFNIRVCSETHSIQVHRLVAYQKFGIGILDKEVIIILDRKNGMSLQSIMNKYNISSKGTVVYICKHSYVVKG